MSVLKGCCTALSLCLSLSNSTTLKQNKIQIGYFEQNYRKSPEVLLALIILLKQYFFVYPPFPYLLLANPSFLYSVRKKKIIFSISAESFFPSSSSHLIDFVNRGVAALTTAIKRNYTSL